jgi:hypothetical protein
MILKFQENTTLGIWTNKLCSHTNDTTDDKKNSVESLFCQLLDININIIESNHSFLFDFLGTAFF